MKGFDIMKRRKPSMLLNKYKYYLIIFILLFFLALIIYPLLNDNLSIGRFDTSKLGPVNTLIVLLPFVYLSCLLIVIINDKDNKVSHLFKYIVSSFIIIFLVFMFIEILM